MKRNYFFVLLLFFAAALAGYLLSKASLVGKVGISLFYQQYKFLKTWWQGGSVVFVVWMVLFFAQGMVQRKKPAKIAMTVHIGAIIAALAGLYFTYDDFRHNISHRLLGERFHLGGYLFWLGWIAISAFYLADKPAKVLQPGTAEQAPAAVQRKNDR